MDEIVREVEMRIAGASQPGCLDAVTKSIQTLDPDAKVRLDPATGILHALTRRETLEVTDALTRAGFEVTGMTGG
jgi:copper chaperone